MENEPELVNEPELPSTIQADNSNVSLYVTGYPQHTSIATLRNLFSPFGSLSDLHTPLNHYNRLPRGFAIVTFSNRDDAEVAHSRLVGSTLLGRPLTVQWSTGTRRSRDYMRDQARRQARQISTLHPSDNRDERGYYNGFHYERHSDHPSKDMHYSRPPPRGPPFFRRSGARSDRRQDMYPSPHGSRRYERRIQEERDMYDEHTPDGRQDGYEPWRNGRDEYSHSRHDRDIPRGYDNGYTREVNYDIKRSRDYHRRSDRFHRMRYTARDYRIEELHNDRRRERREERDDYRREIQPIYDGEEREQRDYANKEQVYEYEDNNSGANKRGSNEMDESDEKNGNDEGGKKRKRDVDNDDERTIRQRVEEEDGQNENEVVEEPDDANVRKEQEKQKAGSGSEEDSRKNSTEGASQDDALEGSDTL